MDEVIFTRGESNNFVNFVNQGETLAVNCTDENDINLLKALLHLYETDQYDLMTEMVEAEQYSVVCHGDMWLNNM